MLGRDWSVEEEKLMVHDGKVAAASGSGAARGGN